MGGAAAGENASKERSFLHATGSVVSKAMVPGTADVKLLKGTTNFKFSLHVCVL